MKKPDIKPATKTQMNKAIECANLEISSKNEISKIILSLFKTVTLSGQIDQFKILEKRLTLAINNNNGWDYKSLNGIYRKGFKVTYAPNVISWLRQFTKLDLDQDSREKAFSAGISGIRMELDLAKETTEPANDSELADFDKAMDDFTKEVNSQELEPVRQQLVDLATDQSIPTEIISTTVRILIDAINQREVA